jgi:hypothetical protein
MVDKINISIYLSEEERDNIRNLIDANKLYENQKAWDKLDEIKDRVESDIINIEERVNIFISLFVILPSYGHFLLPIYYYIRDGKLSINVRKKFFLTLRSIICGDYALKVKEMAEYVLWVEFFEDVDTVEESWDLLTDGADEDELSKIVNFAGPVPYKLKHPVIIKLLSNTNYHNNIINCLAFSINDVYGKIDIEKAFEVFKILKPDSENKNYEYLKNKFQEYEKK